MSEDTGKRPQDWLSNPQRLYPLFVCGAVLFNIGYFSHWSMGALAMLSLSDHIAFFLSNFITIIVGLFVTIMFFATVLTVARSEAVRSLNHEKGSRGVSFYEVTMIVLLLGIVIVFGLVLRNLYLTVAMVAIVFAVIAVTRGKNSLRLAGWPDLLDPIWLVLSILTLSAIFGWGQLAAKYQPFGRTDIAMEIDGSVRTVRLVATAQSGLLYADRGQLAWVASDGSRRILFNRPAR